MNKDGINLEIRRRILCSIYAYAYEYDSTSLVPDGEFDKMMSEIDKSVRTGDDKMDDFFSSDEFTADSGQFIYRHPELKKVEELYYKYHKPMKRI